MDEFRQRDAQLLAVSVDRIYGHGAWAMLRGLEFPLLSDFEPKGRVAHLYDVYREGDGYSERAPFIIDQQGTIRYRHVSPQLHHIPDIYELFDQLDRLKEPAATTKDQQVEEVWPV